MQKSAIEKELLMLSPHRDEVLPHGMNEIISGYIMKQNFHNDSSLKEKPKKEKEKPKPLPTSKRTVS